MVTPSKSNGATCSVQPSEPPGNRDRSVQKITTEIYSLNKVEVCREIDRCRTTIGQLHDNIDAIDRELAEWAQRNINPAPPALDGLRPAALARHVLEMQQVYSWFPDRLDGRGEHEVSFAPEAVDRLRE